MRFVRGALLGSVCFAHSGLPAFASSRDATPAAYSRRNRSGCGLLDVKNGSFTGRSDYSPNDR